MFSEIVDNKSFRELLDSTFASASAMPSPPSESRKGKAKSIFNSSFDPLAWVQDFVHSLLALQRGNKHASTNYGGISFADVLPKVVAFCLQDLQSAKCSRELRAAAARTAFSVSRGCHLVPNNA